MFTEKEEEILKLIVAREVAKIKLDIENQEMGTAIRAEFSTIDARIREEHKPKFQPLQDEIISIGNQLKEKVS